ncbi:cytochrome C5 [Lactobacillus sp. LL6]|uniref:cytochrome C5 n=1 Tax=Lactobacillus sp. LL6 TaxID=2596827 RepID=UPI0011863901|nr:cytochrome C5 [Lactobacillus sp. LL6]TSO26935.1 cytochrome C5 [Lactobacillus sp. LL6]
MAHMSRREYRMKNAKNSQGTSSSKANFAKNKSINREEFRNSRQKPQMSSANIAQNITTREDKRHTLNFWDIFADRPYVAVAVIVVAIILIMVKLWWGLLILAGIVIIGISVIGNSHHPNQVLSLEFKMKASRRLSMLRAIQFGGSILMFLATYMKQVVSVDFSSAGSTDSFQVITGLLSNRGGAYGQQGTYFLNLLNTFTGGQLWSSYRYATNSAQMMSSPSGRWIVMWIFVLMIAPAFCVLSQFFKEPYSRNSALIASIISAISFVLTPVLMRHWVVAYAMENNMSQQAANNAVKVGGMAYVAIICSVVVLLISLYRFIKQDKFE